MKPEDLLGKVVLLNSDDLVEYLREKANDIRYCFLRATPSIDGDKHFQKIISTLAQKQLSEEIINSDEIQSLYTHLAFYFKRANKWGFVDTCTTHIQDNIFRKRLSAWLHYKRYHNHPAHIKEFPIYLVKLSEAIQDGVEDYTYEILKDLHEYKTIGIERLSEDLKKQIIALFSAPDLQAAFPILVQFEADSIEVLPDIVINDDVPKIQVPSPLIQRVFEDNFLEYMKGKNLFGYSMVDATEKVIKKGQADFDKGYETLTSFEVVKLYCYCNMRMHYFTSLSLYERSELLDFYQSSGKVKFIDIGCGPATCGLAFANYIYENTALPAVFDYIGIDSSISMQSQAIEMMKNGVYDMKSPIVFYKEINEVEVDSFADASCIIFNTCYVFASLGLPIDDIAAFIEKLKIKHPYTPKYLVFQNPANTIFNQPLNKRYFEFKELLSGYEIIYKKDGQRICYYYQPYKYSDAKFRDVYFEILKF